MLSTIQDIFVNFAVVFGITIVGALVRYGLSYLQVKTKNERVKLVLEFAEQAVSLAETTNWIGIKKKENAIKTIQQRLEENKLNKYFTYDQLEQYVENAVRLLNQSNDKLTSTSNTTYTRITPPEVISDEDIVKSVTNSVTTTEFINITNSLPEEIKTEEIKTEEIKTEEIKTEVKEEVKKETKEKTKEETILVTEVKFNPYLYSSLPDLTNN